MNKISVIFGVIVLILLIGCTETTISQLDAERIAINFAKGVVEPTETPVIMNSYLESKYWMVLVGVQGEGSITLEINKKTGKIEYLSGGGDRITTEEYLNRIS